jgi:glycosyltransferase involved in cell wall biosynthesis
MNNLLAVHVKYRLEGGEDAVFRHEVAMLRAHGLHVDVLEIPSVDFDSLSAWTRVEIALSSGDHLHGRRLIRRAIRKSDADVVHFHNLYPLLGHGAVAEAAGAGCATVQTLHNYRLTCIAGTHERRGQVCEDCTSLNRAHGVRRGCYRGSHAQSLAMAGAASGYWRMIAGGFLPDRVICLTRFQAQRLIHAGVDSERVVVKANSVEDVGVDFETGRAGACYVGRLSPEKGVESLVDAWRGRDCSLTVCGDGPDLDRLLAAGDTTVRFLGRVNNALARSTIGSSRVAIISSTWFEVLPLTLVESLAQGTPVVCFETGEIGDIVRAIDPGLVCPLGDFAALATAACRVAALPTSEWLGLAHRARIVFESRYTDDINARRLLEVYADAAEARLMHAAPRDESGRV